MNITWSIYEIESENILMITIAKHFFKAVETFEIMKIATKTRNTKFNQLLLLSFRASNKLFCYENLFIYVKQSTSKLSNVCMFDFKSRKHSPKEAIAF